MQQTPSLLVILLRFRYLADFNHYQQTSGSYILFAKLIFGLAFLAMLSPSLAMENKNSTVIDLSRLMQMDDLLHQIGNSRVVFVGESHDRYDHHLAQLAIIEHQHERHENLAIGLEFIQQPFQSVLDDYIAGNIDEVTMLKETDYFKRWGFDFRLYRPIFSFAREHGIALIALNIDKDITDLVKTGGVEALSDAQKKQLPDDIYRDDLAYQERLRDIFMQHPHADEEQFDSFVEIQLLWDESMASRAADWLKQNPDGHMVILAGSGHIVYGSGIPDRLKRRVPVTAKSIINASSDLPITADLGDFVIMTREQNLPPSGKLGVMLDATQNPPNITGFGPDSGAQTAGLEKDDIIVRIDDKEITSYFDVRIALMDKSVDEKVEVEVKREGLLFGDKNRQYDVILK